MLIAPVFVGAALLASAPPVVDHQLDVEVFPTRHGLRVTDTMTVQDEVSVLDIALHAGLKVTVQDASLEVSEQRGFAVGAQRVRIQARAPRRQFVVTYEGAIHHPPTQVATEHQRSFEETSGTIEERGVYLARSSLWYPQLVDDAGPLDELVTARLRVRGLPAGWATMSEGDEQPGGGWLAVTPVDDLHLIAARFTTQVKERTRGVDALVWLRGEPAEDAPLAQRYIEATAQYLALYEELLGPYPYTKFALVENFWETGYGMPSFTLLGPQVVRFPFILRTSYPHELLHNWWGNGVFVEAEGGNWSEGLTAYLADHLMAEIDGRGADYRRATLERYQDFVGGAQDFALRDFTSRFSAASEAVGYGKATMFFHTMRRRLGDDENFVEALRRFYRHHRFDRASFDDLIDAFGAVGGEDVLAWGRDFIRRTGAPTLAWDEVSERVAADGTRKLTIALRQKQREEPFQMDIYVVITLVNGETVDLVMPMRARTARTTLTLPAAAARVDIDPFFEEFRTLLDGETPPALSRTLGAKRVLFVLPTLASDVEKDGWRRFARAVCGDGASCTTVTDGEVAGLPRNSSVWVLGYGNTLRAAATSANKLDARFEDRGFIPPGGSRADRTDPSKTSIALAVPHPLNARHGVVFVGAHRADAVDALARKLPHYGKYGYLGFAGDPVENSLKGQWANTASPLTVFLRAERPTLSRKPPPALRKLPPPFDPTRMTALVRKLADPALRGRGNGSPQLRTALDLVETELKASGLATSRGAFGLEATLPGRNPALPAVVLGAHVDHLGAEGSKIFHGADDNASGVAVLVEVARSLARAGAPERTVRFVAFVGEENGTVGSQAFVKSLGPDPRARVHSMVNLDTVGRRGDKPLLILDGATATEWVHVARGVGFTTGVPVTLAKEGGGASDQKRFNDVGIPAIQVFSGPNADYHRPTDTADKVEPGSLVDAAVVAREIVAYLADRKEPLTAAGAGWATGSASERKASLGTVPDMAFAGVGVRIDGTTPGSAAAKAGLQPGDVLVRFDDKPVDGLRTYSDLLKTKKPGDRVRIVVRRGDKELAFDVELGARD